MDPRERLSKGRAAADVGDYESALREYVWFHNHALEHERSLYGVRLSFALAYWKELASVFPPAQMALENIRDEKVAALSGGAVDRALFHDVASINEYLGAERSTYELFRRLDQEAPAFAQRCAALALEAVVAANDFGLAARYSPDPENELLRFSATLNEDVAEHNAGPPVKAPRLDAYTYIYCNRVRTIIQILTGLGRRDDAECAREWAVALVDDTEIRSRVGGSLYSNNDA